MANRSINLGKYRLNAPEAIRLNFTTCCKSVALATAVASFLRLFENIFYLQNMQLARPVTALNSCFQNKQYSAALPTQNLFLSCEFEPANVQPNRL